MQTSLTPAHHRTAPTSQRRTPALPPPTSHHNGHPAAGQDTGAADTPGPPPAAPSRRLRGIASRCDRYALYERAVQCVEAEIDFVDATFTQLRGRKGSLLREDFCGTLNSSCEWVRRRRTNIAVGVDLDPVPVEWGRRRHLAALKPHQRQRVHFHRGDVLHPPRPPAGVDAAGFDMVLAMNFSFWCFKQRRVMLEYFLAVHGSLAPDGVFFLDFYGGPDAMKEQRERRHIARVRKGEEGFIEGGYNGPFTYIWEQARFNPITGETLCHISFRFPDGSSMRRAFSYDWRLWTLPDIRELLLEAGFLRPTVYWEGDDGKGGGNGEFTASQTGEACPAWICYLSAEK